MKGFLKILREWQELFLILPMTLFLVLFGNTIIHKIDPTAAWIDSGTLSILLFNILVWAVTFGTGYLFYKFSFGDFFAGEWTEKLSPLAGTIANLILWISTLGITAFILLRNI